MVLDAPEVYLSQINASDCTVVHGAIVDDTVCHICGRCPLGGTWNIGRNLAEETRCLRVYQSYSVSENIGERFPVRYSVVV